MPLLLCSFSASACCMGIFGLGLLAVAWLFRRDEPDRWRRMSTRHVGNAALGLIGIGGTTALVCVVQSSRMILLGSLVVPPLLAALVMGILWGRLNHAEGASPLRSNSR